MESRTTIPISVYVCKGSTRIIKEIKHLIRTRIWGRTSLEHRSYRLKCQVEIDTDLQARTTLKEGWTTHMASFYDLSSHADVCTSWSILEHILQYGKWSLVIPSVPQLARIDKLTWVSLETGTLQWGVIRSMIDNIGTIVILYIRTKNLKYSIVVLLII
jgi:hypothetical protein